MQKKKQYTCRKINYQKHSSYSHLPVALGIRKLLWGPVLEIWPLTIPLELDLSIGE